MTNFKDTKTQRRIEIAQKLEIALGPKWRDRLAQGLECEPAQVRRWFTPPKGRNDAPPVAVLAVAEFLSVTPPKSWPERWQPLQADPLDE